MARFGEPQDDGPVPLFHSVRDLPPSKPPVMYARDMPHTHVRRVGRLSAEGVAEMLRDDPPSAIISLHADGRQSVDGPAVDAFNAAVARGTATLLAQGDAQPPGTMLLPEPITAMRSCLERMTAACDASCASFLQYENRVDISARQFELDLDACEEEYGAEGMPEFERFRQARIEERAAAAACAAAAAEAQAAADAEEAHATAMAGLAAAHGGDEEPEAEDALDSADVAAIFVPGAADDAAAVAATEAAAAAKLGRVDLIAYAANVRSRVASLGDTERGCLRDIFRDFGAPGTEEEGAVRSVLVAHQLAMRDAQLERDAAAAAMDEEDDQ